jgi:uncharacterized membrane protein
MAIFKSDLSGMEFDESEKISGRTIRSSLMELMRIDYPSFNESQYLSLSELNIYREKYIANTLIAELGELTELEKTVIQSMSSRTLVTDLPDEDEELKALTFGQRVADKVATFGGSWTFIISFGVFILLWISANVVLLLEKGFDPYPFILLNLILSCIAALQAPVIMMSQNRQEEKDRERAKNDYMVNLKSELEIRVLHEKIDHMALQQHQEILETQKMQIEMLTDLLKRYEQQSTN